MFLIQEIKVRFGTTFALAERFVKALSEASSIPEDANSRSMDENMDSVIIERTATGNVSDAPALNCIVNCISFIISAQIKLEADKTPNYVLGSALSGTDSN